MTDIKTVFFHELGHFIAHELNFRKNGLGKPISIEIERVFFDNSFRYKGRTMSENSDKLPEKLSSLIYGCILQSIYLKRSFSSCFGHDLNGEIDASSYSWLLKGFSNDIKSSLIKKEDNYIKHLEVLKLGGHFDIIFNLEIDNYWDNNPNNILVKKVNINLLKSDISSFLDNHQKYYFQFLDELSSILI